MSKLKLLFGNLEEKDARSASLIKELRGMVSMIDATHNEFFGKYDISLPKFGALLVLYDNAEDGVMLSYIGEQLLVSKANITGLVDRLEKQGLVARIRDNDDRRKISATLTDKGRKFTEMIIQKYRELSDKVFLLIEDDDQDKLIGLLQKLQVKIAIAKSERERMEALCTEK